MSGESVRDYPAILFLSFFYFSDVFSSQMWIEFDASMPGHLRSSADQVKRTVLAAKADGTIKTYLGGFNRWKRWAIQNCLCHFPANPFYVAVYLQCLLQQAQSPSPVCTAVYSIDWAHSLAGLSKPSTHPLVTGMVTASKRILGKPKSRKEPITPEMLLTLVRKFKDNPSLYNLRTVALCLIGFTGFFRFSELCGIRACDVQLFPSYISIFLETSKTDQLREGSWVAISRTDRETCPVRALERYIAAAEMSLEENLPLFRAIAAPSSSCKMRQQGISYTRASELVKEAFDGITDTSKISLHSLRAGGATAAANAGVPDRLFKRHGRWSSENAKDGYIKDNLNSLLSVSKSLGI